MPVKSLYAALVLVLLVLPSPLPAQGAKLSESSLKIAEIDRQIEQQRTKNKVAAVKKDQTLKDSAAAAVKANKKLDSLSRTIMTLSDQVDAEKKSLADLEENLADLRGTKGKREEERAIAAEGSHSAVAAFDPQVKSCRDSLETANAGLELARNDSMDLQKKIKKELTKLSDSASAMEKSIAAFKRRADSLSLVQKKLERDSVTAKKTADDTLAAAQKRLGNLRRSIAAKDSAIKSATEDLNSSKKDSIAAQIENQDEAAKREKDISGLDSLLSALQAQKSGFLRMREKFLLDSAIEALSAQLGTFLNKSYEARNAATGPDAEKAQMLEVYKGKVDNLMRDEAFSAMVAEASGGTWQEKNKWVNGRLAWVQPAMDSASTAREKTVRDGVLAGKEFQQTMKNMSAQNKSLSDFVARTWKEMINLKPQLVKLEKDTAAAVKRGESTAGAFSKKQATARAEAAAATAGADSITRLRDALLSFITEKNGAHANQLANVSLAVVQAGQVVSGAQSALDAAMARQKSARDDSVRVDNEKSVFVSQALQVTNAKKDEITLKNNAIKMITDKLTKARSDSSAAYAEKLEQQKVFSKLIADQQRLIKQGEKAIADLEVEREIAATPPPAPKPEPVVTAPPEPNPQTAVAPEPSLAPVPQPMPQPQAQSVAQTQKPSVTQEAAERQITLLYELIDQGKTETAVRVFNSNRKLLEKNLFPEAFEAIKASIESLSLPQPAAAAPAPQETPVPSSPAPFPVPEPAAPQVPAEPAVSAPASPPEPEVERKPATIFISSVPPVASVYMDGQLVGRTNVGNVKVTSGKHTMQFIKGDKTCTREMTFSEGQNQAVVVKLPCGQ